jgi:hypothetical protein
LTKDSPRAEMLIQPQVSKPSPTPLPPSQKATPSKKTSLNAQAGPSSTPIAQAGPSSAPSNRQVPSHFQVLVDTLRQNGGFCTHSSLPSLLLSRDPGVYKKAQVSKYTRYIEAAMTAGLVQKITKAKSLCICLSGEYL